MNNKTLVVLFLHTVMLFGLPLVSVAATQAHIIEDAADTTSSSYSPVETHDILALNQATKDYLDLKVAHLTSRSDKVLYLHDLLFTAEGRNIRYDSSETKTAQQTFDSGSGDCVSLANLFVAAARHIGLKARYQKVDTPLNWEQDESFLVIPGHMNVSVFISPTTQATVELVSTYLYSDAKNKKITDKQAFAEYYSNKGVEFLSRGDYINAISLLRKATDVDKKLDFAWSNLGVAYKFNGQFEAAEHAYHKSLKLNSRRLATVKNLYLLYREMGRDYSAIQKKVERYIKKNPYSLAKTAELYFQDNYFEQAKGLYLKAIKKKPDEERFHHGLAKTYYMLGDLENATLAQQKAVALATEKNKTLYISKLNHLLRVSR